MTEALVIKSRNSGSAVAAAAVYLSALLQGLTLVSFPASSAMLRQLHGFSDAQYGAIFLPQVALAVIGAVSGGVLVQRLGLKTLLVLALAANGFSQALLAASSGMAPAAAYAIVLAGTASLGFGFGLSGAPLNSYPPALFPSQANTAVVALHSSLGLGLMIGPLLAAALMQNWITFPLILLAFSCALAALAVAAPLPRPRVGESIEIGNTAMMRERPQASVIFWICIAIAVLYAFAEGTFSNWIVIYLQETKRLPENIAAAALSVFWGALVVGRLGISVLVLRMPAERIWRALPILMILAFLLLPYADGAMLGIGLFALAGIACSAFFPLTIAIASKRFENHVAWVASMLTAALMLGVGLGSFAVGSLREMLALESLYRLSALYPLAALALIASVIKRSAR